MTRQELTNRIASTLNEVAGLGSDAQAAKNQLANELASTIDAYVQAAIGERMLLLTAAFVTPTGPLSPSAGFAQFTRQR